jgi:hypothetical protein
MCWFKFVGYLSGFWHCGFLFLRRVSNNGVLPVENSSHHFRKVLQQVETVCNLLSLWRTFRGALCVDAAAITRDNLDFWMPRKPFA